jgi:hypothetical protein
MGFTALDGLPMGTRRWMIGRMGLKHDAVAFLDKTCPPRLDLSLITRALRCRQADAGPDSVFAARTATVSGRCLCRTSR